MKIGVVLRDGNKSHLTVCCSFISKKRETLEHL